MASGAPAICLGRLRAWCAEVQTESKARDATTRREQMGTAALVCLSFLLSSTGYLAWLYHVAALVDSALVSALVLAGGSLAQAVGIGIWIGTARRATSTSRRLASSPASLVAPATLLHLPLVAGATLSSGLASTLVCGYLANVFYGALQGWYLELICRRVESRRRGTVFGCGYGASTMLTWLLSLPAGGALTRGVPCLACCVGMSVALIALASHVRHEIEALDEGRAAGALDLGSARSDATIAGLPAPALVGLAILLTSVVKSVSFSFPADNLAAGVDLELSRVLYGAGLIAVGLASDRDRRSGFVVCAASLVMPFLVLALAGIGISGAPLWMLAYLFAGVYVLFCVLPTIDLADRTTRPELAGAGMLVRHVGDAVGTGLSMALASVPFALVALDSALYVASLASLATLYSRLFARAEDQVGNALSEMEREQLRFERFAASHQLSARERDVLRLVLAEKSNPEIAGALVITERTVKFHVGNLLRKTGCKTRLEVLARYAEQP